MVTAADGRDRLVVMLGPNRSLLERLRYGPFLRDGLGSSKQQFAKWRTQVSRRGT